MSEVQVYSPEGNGAGRAVRTGDGDDRVLDTGREEPGEGMKLLARGAEGSRPSSTSSDTRQTAFTPWSTTQRLGKCPHF